MCVLLVNNNLCILQVKSVKTGSVFWTIGCCLSYFYMVRKYTQCFIFMSHSDSLKVYYARFSRESNV